MLLEQFSVRNLITLIKVMKFRADRASDQRLDIRRTNARGRADGGLTVLQQRVGDIVAIAHALLVGVARAHQVPAIIEDQSHQRGRRV